MSQRSKKIKFLLVLLIIVTLGAVISIFMYNRLMSSPSGKLLKAIQSEANVAINNVRQTAMRNGIQEWTLDAESAFLLQAEKKALFKTPKLVFFMEGSDKVFLSAEEGVLWTDTNDLDVSGEVVVKHNDYELNTEKLHYEHKKRIIWSDAPVEIFGDLFQFTADSMTFTLESNETRLKGNVKGILSGTFTL